MPQREQLSEACCGHSGVLAALHTLHAVHCGPARKLLQEGTAHLVPARGACPLPTTGVDCCRATSSPGQLGSSTRILTSHHCQERALCALLCTQSYHGQGAHILPSCSASRTALTGPSCGPLTCSILCTIGLQPMSHLLLLVHERSSQLRGLCCGSLGHSNKETCLPRVAPAGCTAARLSPWLHLLITPSCSGCCM